MRPTVMASVEDEQANTCEGTIPCGVRQRVNRLCIEPKRQLMRKASMTVTALGRTNALCGASAIGSEGGDAASFLTQIVDQEIFDSGSEAVVDHAEQSWV